ncbi:MAG: DUF2608 domain-containing protein [Gammaproteobacteria bacterium]|nr:DUF2608 domain-containing protein [Gammaproteobacteria bacterium]
MFRHSKIPLGIFEAPRLRNMLKYCQFNSVIIFDLDNTVIESTQALCSDQWFVGLLKYAATMITDEAEVRTLVLSIYHAAQHYAKMQKVEKNTLKIINALQAIGLPVIALTARSTSIAEPTLRQLKDIDLAFSKNLYPKSLAIHNNENKSSTYRDGIIFCDGCNKGAILINFFKQIGFRPLHIVMVDDQLKNLNTVQSFLEPSGIPFAGLRYAFLDLKTQQVDLLAANQQLQTIIEMLPIEAQEAAYKLQLIDSKSSLKP